VIPGRYICRTNTYLLTDPEREPLLERTKSFAGTIPKQGSVRPPLGQWQRLQPEPEYITPCSPPDISCADIPEEQLARTYSRSCVWDPKVTSVPPMQEMKGFGRFRRSVHADANWELTQYRDDLQRLGPIAVQHLGDFEIAGLKTGVMNNIRTPSYTSLHSRSDSGESTTCPRVCKGFAPTRISPITQPSGRRKSSTSREGSRTTSPDVSYGTTGRFPPPSKRTSFLRFDAGSAPLETIKEAGDIQPKKRSVPLIFDAAGTTDAVIDDDDYETCEDSFVPPQVRAKIVAHETIAAAVNWHERKAQMPAVILPTKARGFRHNRTSDQAPEKARVPKKATKQTATRRLSSRDSKALANRVTCKENQSPPVASKLLASSKNPTSPPSSMLPFAVSSPRRPPTPPETRVDGIPAGSSLCKTKQRTSATRQSENSDSGRRSDLTNQICKGSFRRSSQLTLARGRERSHTAMRVQSGNIPILYVEGKVKQVVDGCQAERKGLQPMAV
jgi:hypothetical protein